MAGDSARILANLKAALRARGVTYAVLAKRIGLSEPSVKRVLSRGTLSLRRLEQICEAIGTSVAEVVQLPGGSGSGRSDMLTIGQEKALAADPKLLSCYHLVANGRTPREIETDLLSPARAVQLWLEQLMELGLVARYPRGRLHATAAVAPRWRPDGPMRRMYEQEVRAEFLQSLFGAEREALHFMTAELSAASCRVLQRKLDRLAADFRDLADLDSTLPGSAKRNVGCLLAMRPWVFSRYLSASAAPTRASPSRRARQSSP